MSWHSVEGKSLLIMTENIPKVLLTCPTACQKTFPEYLNVNASFLPELLYRVNIRCWGWGPALAVVVVMLWQMTQNDVKFLTDVPVENNLFCFALFFCLLSAELCKVTFWIVIPSCLLFVKWKAEHSIKHIWKKKISLKLSDASFPAWFCYKATYYSCQEPWYQGAEVPLRGQCSPMSNRNFRLLMLGTTFCYPHSCRLLSTACSIC